MAKFHAQAKTQISARLKQYISLVTSQPPPKLSSELVVGIRSVKFDTNIKLAGEGGRELEESAPSSRDTGLSYLNPTPVLSLDSVTSQGVHTRRVLNHLDANRFL